MLEIAIAESEWFDEKTQEFVYIPACVLKLEHSLYSVRRWEAAEKRPFISGKDMEKKDIIRYVRYMTLNEVEPLVYDVLGEKHMQKIIAYIDDNMTATTFSDIEQKNGRSNILTAEIIYYWMTVFNIPFECQYWHLNQLLTLIKVCDRKQNPPKKPSKSKLMARNARLNKQRRTKLGSRG